jgi:NarL family two-component system sensor histidine kinase YdfH
MLSVEVQNHLLKIISEGLTNIAKHAQANQAWLRLTENKSHLVLEIEDDGQGFVSESDHENDGHYGLLGIRERVALLGGEFSMDSQLQQGTCLLIQIPLHPQGEKHV